MRDGEVLIGKIVKSNSHIDYVCQVFGPGETGTPPQPTDFAFGSFVAIQLESVGVGIDRLVGVIYNTQLLNPDFGSLGPRLSPRPDLAIFTPDYLAETATLVGVIAVGWQDAEGRFHQGTPLLAATVNNVTTRLTAPEIAAFHVDDRGGVALRYAPALLAQNNPLAPQLLLTIVDQLVDMFPQQQRQLAVMRNTVAWKSIVQPVG